MSAIKREVRKSVISPFTGAYFKGKLKDKAWLVVEENEIHIHNEDPWNNTHANANPFMADSAPLPDLPRL